LVCFSVYGRQENRRRSGAPQARKNAQRIFAIHALASFLAEYGVDALGMLGGRAPTGSPQIVK